MNDPKKLASSLLIYQNNNSIDEQEEVFQELIETAKQIKLVAPEKKETQEVHDAIDILPERLRFIRLPEDNGNKPIIEQLLPLRYPEMDQQWLDCYDNNWKPEAIDMSEDKRCWNAAEGSDKYIDKNTRNMVLANLSFFGTAEQLIGDNVMGSLYTYITMPEVRNQILRLAYEESAHSRTFMWIIKNLNLNEKEIYAGHENIPCIQAKDQFMKDATYAVAHKQINLKTKKGRRTLMEAILAQIIMEGVLFYGGFAMNLYLKEQNKLTGIGEQYEYVMRDESQHLLLMRNIFNHLKDKEWPEIWDEDFKQFTYQKFDEAVEIEYEYAKYALQIEHGGVKGLKLEEFNTYTDYLVNRRLEWIDLKPRNNVNTNPFKFLEKLIDLPKSQNFFEGHVTDYRDEDNMSGY